MSGAYYNENDTAAADWLENLIAADLIAPGVVDRRSIKEVQPDDVRGFTQVHLFAGIGGWSKAARLAGWADTRPIWTASCPCQPFSGAGKRLGEDDPRHLWPDVFRLWRAVRPPVLVGEQVAGKAGHDWFNGVRSDLDRESATARAVDIPACAIDAPHQRNRLYWVALGDACVSPAGFDAGSVSGAQATFGGARQQDGNLPHGLLVADGCHRQSLHAHAHGSGRDGRAESEERGPSGGAVAERDYDRVQSNAAGIGCSQALGEPGHCGTPQGQGAASGVECLYGRGGVEADERGRDGVYADANQPLVSGQSPAGQLLKHESHGRSDLRPNGSWWAGADWIICHDDKARRVADASAPLLVASVRGRVAIPRPGSLDPRKWPEETRLVSRIAAWKGFGNAIVPPLAAEVLASLLDVMGEAA